MKIEIKCRYSAKVLFAFERENNTIKLTLEAAVKAGASLVGASLDGARLNGARLNGASLVGASLDGASLDGASLDRARLNGARLDGASLDGASLDGASLVGASLDGARLNGARLNGASLDGASLVGARLNGARLDGAVGVESLCRTMIVPEEGSFVGFKKICTKDGKKVIRVLIPENAKRVGGTAGRKCRAEFVQMLEDVSGCSDWDSGFKYEYKAGDLVYPDKFDGDITKECTNGIHFFITRKEAEDY